MKNRSEGFSALQYACFGGVTLLTMLVCICVGSVPIGAADALSALWRAAWGLPSTGPASTPIIVVVRTPRVLSVALSGAALSLCGGAMQGLLRNPLADGATLGVSSGASLGAILTIAFGLVIPGMPLASSVVMAMLFAFLSLLLILSLAYKLDRSLSTHTIILIGVIFTMFAHSIISIIVTFAGEKVKSILFWTLGSLAGSRYADALLLLAALAVCGGVILRFTRELNAFAIGEDNARHVGVRVKQVKLAMLVSVSALIGVCVAIGGTIGFVGLIIPHMVRMIVGPNHKRLLPASLFAGAIFLLLADLLARTALSPLELPIGVITSLTGSIAFVYIFYATRRVK